MADPTNPSNSSVPDINVNNLDAAQKSLAAARQETEKLGLNGTDAIGKINNAFAQFLKRTQESSQSFSVLNATTELARRAQELLGVSLKATSTSLGNIGSISQETAKNVSLIGTALLGPAKILQNIGGDTSLESISDQIGGIIDSANDATAPIQALAKQLGIAINPSQLKSGMMGPLIEDIKNVGAAIDKSINMERAVFTMSAQSGQLSTLLDGIGKDFKNLGVVSGDYTHALENIRQATGATDQQLGQYFNLIQSLPKASKDNADSTQLVSNQMTKLQSVMTLANGTGQDFQTVLGQTRTMLETYNGTAEQAYDLTARSSELSKNYGATLATTTGYLTQMADSFKLLGDNTEGASGIFEEMFQGLRDGGLGMKPAIDTIGQMTNSIANLSVAQKAFISSRSGGPGGLLGSIQIEKDIASGNAQGVFEKLRKSFTQQAGGKIITRDEVQTQAQAAQFEKQRQLLMSPAFGGMAKTEEQASAILKAFSEANKGKGVKDPAALLNDTMKQGTDYQKLSSTSLVHMSATLDDIAAAGGFTAAKIFQNAATEMSDNAAIANPLAARREGAMTELNTPSTGMNQGDKNIRTGLSNLIGDAKNSVAAAKELTRLLAEPFTKSDQQNTPVTNAPGSAVHQATRAALAHHTTPTATAGPPTPHPTAAPTQSTTPHTTVNVYIDGKKIVPDRVQASHGSAIGPAGANN